MRPLIIIMSVIRETIVNAFRCIIWQESENLQADVITKPHLVALLDKLEQDA